MLQSAFNMQPGEGRRVGLLLIFNAATLVGVTTIGYSGAASTLFLSQLPASATPYLLIFPAIGVALSLFLYNRVGARIEPRRLVFGSTLLLLGGLLIFRLLLETAYASQFATLAGLYLFMEVAFNILSLQWWMFVGELFNAREARRVLSLIMGGATVANIAAGFMLGPLANLFGVKNLLFISALAMVVCWFCARALLNYNSDSLTVGAAQDAPRANAVSFRQAIGEVWQVPLLRGIAGLAILLTLLFNTSVYQYLRGLQDAFAGRGQAMAEFMGVFAVWTSLAAIVIQFYLGPRIIRRLGVFAALLLFPMGSGLGATAVMLTGGALIAMAVMRAAAPVFQGTMTDVAINILYLPVPSEQGRRAYELTTAASSVVLAMLGIVFLVTQAISPLPYYFWSIPLLGLVLVYIGVLAWTRRQYVRALAENVSHAWFDLSSGRIDATDPTTVQALAAALQHPDSMRALHALELIATAPDIEWDLYVAPLLSHASPDVRTLALRHLARPGNAAQTEGVAALFNAPEESVRAAAIEAYCTIEGQRAVRHVIPHLSDSSPDVQAAAVLGLIRHGGLDGILATAATLKSMVESEDPLLRRESARVLGKIGVPTVSATLLPLLDDADPQVRVEAVRAAGALRSPELVPHLMDKLGDGATAPAAADVLAVAPDALMPVILPALSALLSDSQDPAVRARVPGILARMNSRQAAELLLAHLYERDERVRFAVYYALSRLRAKGVNFSIPETLVQETVIRELGSYYELFALREDLNSIGEDPLLSDTLATRMRNILDRVFYLLAVLHGGQGVERVQQTFNTHHSTSDRRAEAVELLDNLSLGQAKELLVTILEAPTAQVLDVARRRFSIQRQPLFARLADLAQGVDPWLRACALWRIGTLPEAELSADFRELISEGLQSDDPLVRETALVVELRIGSAQGTR